MLDGKLLAPLLGFATVAALQFVHAKFYRPPAVDAFGWHWLRPGFMHYFAMLGATAFAGFMWWLFLFVGSARADAAKQEIFMLLIATAMTAGALYVWWMCFARRYAWREDAFKVTTFKREALYDLRRLSEIQVKSSGQSVRLRFSDGRTITFSADMHGADELTTHIDQIIF